MKVEIKYRVSNKIVDAIARIVEPSLEQIFRIEIISFETLDDSQENIEKWLSAERREEFERKLNESDLESTYKVVEIVVSRSLKSE